MSEIVGSCCDTSGNQIRYFAFSADSAVLSPVRHCPGVQNDGKRSETTVQSQKSTKIPDNTVTSNVFCWISFWCAAAYILLRDSSDFMKNLRRCDVPQNTVILQVSWINLPPVITFSKFQKIFFGIFYFKIEKTLVWKLFCLLAWPV